MKMKSSLFGFNAKIALAVMAICGGLFTSCYEKDDADITPPGKPSYRIAGTITDYLTEAKIAGATVVVGTQTFTSGTDGTVTGDITAPTGNSESRTIKISATGYLPIERTATIEKVVDGAIFVLNVSAALLDETVPMPDEIEAIAMATGDWDAAKAALTNPLKLDPATKETLNSMSPAGEVTATDPTPGTVSIPYIPASNQVSFADYAQNPDKVGYVWYDGFELAADPVVSRAIDTATAIQIFKNGVAFVSGYPAGFNQVVGEFTVPLFGTYSVSGYTGEYKFIANKYEAKIDGKTYTGVAIFQESLMLYPKYFSHDTHDTHDSHDGHGVSNPNAGGGSGGY